MKINILLADDNQLFREIMAERFKETDDIEVIAEAEDGQEIFEKVRIFNPEIILMDIGIPCMKGIETTKSLYREFPDIKVIALTTRKEKSYIKGMLEANAWGYLLKSSSYEQLVDSIRQIHSGRKCLSTSVEKIIIDDYLGRNSKGSESLTNRESEILKSLAEGKSIREISEKLFISIKTVGTHKQNIFDKLQFENMAQLIKYALKNGIVS